MRDFFEGILAENVDGAMPIYLKAPRLLSSSCLYS